MSAHGRYWSFIAKPAVAAALLLLIPPAAQAQPHAAMAAGTGSKALMQRDLIGLPGKEVVMSRVEIPPGVSGPAHRHDAQVFVYMLQGSVVMQVKGGPRVTLKPGDTFYEGPTDIHTLSVNPSKTEPASFLAILIKDKGKPSSIPVPPAQAQ